jgi:hypothetical protein
MLRPSATFNQPRLRLSSRNLQPAVCSRRKGQLAHEPVAQALSPLPLKRFLPPETFGNTMFIVKSGRGTNITSNDSNSMMMFVHLLWLVMWTLNEPLSDCHAVWIP